MVFVQLTYPWSQSDNKDPSEIVENKTANEAMISSACSDSNRVTNLIDIYPLYKLGPAAWYKLTLESTGNDVIKAFLIDVIPQITNCFANSLIPQLKINQ